MLSIIVIASVVVLAIAVPALAQGVTFDADAIGAAPKGWTLTMTGKGTPHWTVEQDDTAPSRGHVLKQSGTATYPLALKEGTRFTDGFVEARFKLVSGRPCNAEMSVIGFSPRTSTFSGMPCRADTS